VLGSDHSATAFTLADSRFFIGVVALLNSLRLTGHDYELVVLDCGFTDEQRARLNRHATVVTLPPELAARTVLAKPFFRELAPVVGVALWLDADVLVTGPLEPIVETARNGHVCAYPVDRTDLRDRRFSEWTALFGLATDPRTQVYVNAGFFALGLPRHRTLLDRWWQTCETIPTRTVFAGDIQNPFWAGDQDALNALLMSEVPAADLLVLPESEAVFPPAAEDARVLDRARLYCELDGQAVRLVHYSWVPKPWEPLAWRRTRRPLSDVYRQLLPRVLFEPDVTLRLTPREVPPSLRPGLVGASGRATIAVARPLRLSAARLAGLLPARAHGRLLELRDRLEPPDR
jgi:hypothetical protein